MLFLLLNQGWVMLRAWDAGGAAAGQSRSSMGTECLWHCSVRLVAQLWCSAIASGPAGSTQGQLCRDPRCQQSQMLRQSRNSFSPLKMLQSKDPPNTLSGRCKKRTGTKDLLRVTMTHSL